jgi:hypothetical protein
VVEEDTWRALVPLLANHGLRHDPVSDPVSTIPGKVQTLVASLAAEAHLYKAQVGLVFIGSNLFPN